MTLLVVGWGSGAALAQSALSEFIRYSGMCDASAGISLSPDLFVAADDEGNQLRIFDSRKGGKPLRVFDLTGFLRLEDKHPEADFEGAARIGERIYWIGSHGRNKDGKYRPNRHCFFATRVREEKGAFEIVPEGLSYKNLLTDLLLDARLKPFNLAIASTRAPKSKGALNIEGLCATPDQGLLIGFRNPIPRGRALIVPLLNPDKVVSGYAAQLGDPLLLDLGGLGVRDMGYWKGNYYILAGSYEATKDFRLYRWPGGNAAPQPLENLDFKSLNPEALVFYEDETRFQILSDDGTRKIDGTNCKQLTDPALKRFRGAWVNP